MIYGLYIWNAKDQTLTAHTSGIYNENVYSWSHLGHILSANLLDDDDILARRNGLIGHSFLCNFS